MAFRNVGNLPLISNKAGGTIVKIAAGSGRSEINWAVDNNGTVEADAGTLAMSNGSSVAGGAGIFYSKVASARVEFGSGQHILNGGTRFTGAGRGLITTGEVTLKGAVNVGASGAPAGGFEQKGGTLDGPGSLSVTGGAGTCVWSTGQVSTTYNLDAGATLAVDTTQQPYLNSATLNNAGTIIVSASDKTNVQAVNGNASTLNNQSGGVIQLANDGPAFRNVGNLPTISNKAGGTIVKTVAASGRSEINWAVDNNGTVEADAGTLAMSNGSSVAGGAGIFYSKVASARVEFGSGQHILNGGTRFTGAGRGLITTGEVTLKGAVNVGASGAPAGGFEQKGGTLDGPGSLSVTGGAGTCVWSTGQVSTTYNLDAGATLAVDTTQQPYLNSATLNNAGTIIVSASDKTNVQAVNGNASTLNNQSGGVIQLANDGPAFRNVGNLPTISNSGTIVKTVGTGTSDLGSYYFQNNAGGIFGANAGTLSITAGATLAAGSNITGGTVLFNSAVTWNGQSTVKADLHFRSAVTFNSATLVQDAGGRLRWDTGSFAGTLSIPAGTTLEADSSGQPYLSSLTLNNSGTITVSASDASQPQAINGSSSVLNNLSGGVIQLARDGAIFRNVGNTPSVINGAGATIIKTAGTGTTDFGSFNLDNRGTLSAPAGRTLLLSSGMTVNAASQIAGAGKVSTADMVLNAAISVATGSTLDFGSAGGTLTGNAKSDGTALGVINGPGALRLSGNRVTGKVNLGSTLVTVIDTTNNPYFDSLILNNAGAMTVTGGTGVLQGNSTTFSNLAGASIQIAASTELRNVGNVPSFVNAGLVRLGAAPVVLTSSWAFAQTNTGTLSFALAGTNPSTPQFSQVKLNADALPGGTLEADLSTGYVPVNGAAYPILTFASTPQADFAKFTDPSVPAGTILTKKTSATGITLTASVVPKITSVLTAAATQGTAFSYQTVASNSPTSYSATGLPAGLSISATTGKITGTPTASGSFSVALSATNAAGKGTATLVITVKTVAPVVTSATAATTNVGAAFAYQITATNTPTSYGASGLPSGVTVDTATGKISGTAKVAGTYSVTLAAFNSAGAGTAKLALSVKAAVPVINSATTAAANVGAAFTYQITATNSPTSYSASGLPTGLSVSTSTGKITGTPTKAGTYAVNITATNSGGTGSGKVTITVKALPVITSALMSSGKVGVAFSYQIAATNSPTSYGASGLPSGLAIATSTGKITGTPKTSGTFAVTLAASNANGSGTAKLTLTVAASAPVITSAKTVSGKTGTAFTYQIVASNTPTSYAATGLPAGLSVSASTGKISGTPTAAATSTVTISASNSAGKGSATLTISISKGSASSEADQLASKTEPGATKPELGSLPHLTSARVVELEVGQPFSYQIAANFEARKFAARRLPEGLALDHGTGIIAGTPTTIGTYEAAISAAAGQADELAAAGKLTLTVSDKPVLLPIVSLAAGTANSIEPGFTLNLSHPASMDLVVQYEVQGTAVNGSDYQLLKGIKKIKAGTTSATIKLVPAVAAEGETTPKTVELMLMPGEGYTIDSPEPMTIELTGMP